MKPIHLLLAATLAMATAPALAVPDEDVCLDKRSSRGDEIKRPSLNASRHLVALDSGRPGHPRWASGRLKMTGGSGGGNNPPPQHDFCVENNPPVPPPPPPVEPPCHTPTCNEN